MKKRVLSIIICMCMVVTLLPTVAFAIETYDVWVAGEQVTSDNKDGITGEGISGTVTYDPSTNTLTLSDAVITNTSYFETRENDKISCGIRVTGSSNINIQVIGSNTVTDACNESIFSYGIIADNAINIDGDGSLTVEASDSPNKSIAINAGGALTIDNVELTAIGGNNSVGSTGILTCEYITIENSNVIAKGGNIVNPSISDDYSYGIMVANGGTITVNSGALVAESGTATTSKDLFFRCGWNYNGVSSVDLTNYTEGKEISVGDKKDSAVAWDNNTALDTYKYLSITPIITAADYAADAESGMDYEVDDTASPKTIHIKTAKGAAWWSANSNSYIDCNVYLDADIDVSDFRWSPVGTLYSQFTGNFYGQGHSISGLNSYHNIGTYDLGYAGMFAAINNSTISDLILIGVSCVANCPQNEGYGSETAAGSIVARNDGGSIINCFASGSVSASGGRDATAGGLVGIDMGGLSLKNCYCSCSVTSTYGTSSSFAGGLVGFLNGGIENCYSIGTVEASDAGSKNYSDGLACYCYGDPWITNCFYLSDTVLNRTSSGVGNITITGCGTFDSSGVLTAGTQAQFGTDQILEKYADTLLNALNGWVDNQVNNNYNTWVADSVKTPVNGGYPIFGSKWAVLQAEWGVATGEKNDQPPVNDSDWNKGSLTSALAYANSLESGTAYIKLLENVENALTQSFAKNKTTILDLNGKSITAKKKEFSDHNNNVLVVSGQLTLCDSSTATVANQGKITGGNGTQEGTGGGVLVEKSGTFIMTGGNITNNNAIVGGGVENEGTFTMTGGSISNNSCAEGKNSPAIGGGVTNLGTFNMTGGSITGNTISEGGTGAGVANVGNMTLKGNIDISGNKTSGTDSNVALIYGTALGIDMYSKLNISGELTNENQIGVSIVEATEDDGTLVFTPKTGVITSGETVKNSDYAEKFVSDCSNFAIMEADDYQLQFVDSYVLLTTSTGIKGFEYSANSTNGTDGNWSPYTGVIIVSNGSSMYIKALLEPGYTFGQWDTDITDNPLQLKNISGKVSYTPTSTIVYTSGGGGEIFYYSVKFETNGGSHVNSQSVRKNSTLKAITPPTKDGYTFDGWYTDKELTKAFNTDDKIVSGITLYAKWTEIPVNNSTNDIILTIGKKEAVVFGNIKLNDVAPLIKNNCTMLPARFVAENLGAKVEWDETGSGIVTITKDKTVIVIRIGDEYATVNGKQIKLDSPAFVENDRTYTPLRFVAENLGANVTWNGAEQKVIITK